MVSDELNYGGAAALVLIDLDHFKSINDRFGHGAGDEGLRQAAMRLQRALGDTILTARIGGDEFAALVRAPLGLPRIEQMLDRAVRAIGQPLLWNGARVPMSVSAGAAIIERPHRRRLSRLFAEADSALCAAKAAGRNVARIFDEGEAPCDAWERPARTSIPPCALVPVARRVGL